MTGMHDFEEATLSNLSSGVANEFFEREFKKVLENISDINTSLAARTITVKVTIKPNESRENGEISIKASSTLAPAKEHKDPIYFSKVGLNHVAFQSQKIIQNTLFDNVSIFDTKKAQAGDK